jgi:nucleotide-binding universal stress UspA family protein
LLEERQEAAMIEIRRILCPTDFSESSYDALSCATALARWYRAEVHAVVVLPRTPQAWSDPPTLDLASLEPIREDRFVARLSEFTSHATAAGVAACTKVLYGSPDREIVRYADGIAAELIVMGTHGRAGFPRLLLGSVTEKVLRHADRPVLTVRQGASPRGPFERPPFQSLLCPIDFSPSSLRAIPYVFSLGEEANARVTLLHVRTPEQRPADEALDHLRALVPRDAREWCQIREVVTTGRVSEEILGVAETTDARLIVMGVQRRGGLGLRTFGSTTHHTIRHAHCPVLTIATDNARDSRRESAERGVPVAG